MTRLTAADVFNLTDDWAAFDHGQRRALGLDLLELAARAADLGPEEVRRGLAGRRLAALSLSSGQGVVTGFASGLAAIGRRLGLEAQAMPSPDQAGLAEAEAWGAEWLIYADDREFIVRDLAGTKTADNNPATSRVFVAALEQMAGGLRGREVVVLGLGVIGRGAARRLLELGARPLMYDVAEARGRAAAAEMPAADLLADRAALARALKSTNLILEATCVPEALEPALYPTAPVVAAPGVPLSWPAAWLRGEGGGRLWHDPLPSGTAAMLAQMLGGGRP